MDKNLDKNSNSEFDNNKFQELRKNFMKLASAFGDAMGIQHVQKSGMAHYDDYDKFLFTPDAPVKGYVAPFHGHGFAQLMSDGTFDFILRPRQRTQSVLIRKLAHGRVSQTKDGAIQLTIKVFQDEGVNISQTIAHEALIATKAVADWQLTR